MQNTEQSHFSNTRDTLRFLLGGNATITFKSMKTEQRYTFRIRQSEDGKLYFVSLLTGSDNTSDYTYMGIVSSRSGALEFRLTRNSRYTAESLPVRAFRYVLGSLLEGHMPINVELWHEGRCGRCGRMLTVPSSIATGIGPECALKMTA